MENDVNLPQADTRNRPTALASSRSFLGVACTVPGWAWGWSCAGDRCIGDMIFGPWGWWWTADRWVRWTWWASSLPWGYSVRFGWGLRCSTRSWGIIKRSNATSTNEATARPASSPFTSIIIHTRAFRTIQKEVNRATFWGSKDRGEWRLENWGWTLGLG